MGEKRWERSDVRVCAVAQEERLLQDPCEANWEHGPKPKGRDLNLGAWPQVGLGSALATGLQVLSLGEGL